MLNFYNDLFKIVNYFLKFADLRFINRFELKKSSFFDFSYLSMTLDFNGIIEKIRNFT